MPRRSRCCRYPTRPTLRIEVADPQHSLVLYGSPADMGAKDSWERLSSQTPVSVVVSFASVLHVRSRLAYRLVSVTDGANYPRERPCDDLLRGRYPRGRAGLT